MAKFKFDDQDEKLALVENALRSKPRMDGVIATAKGWEIERNNGTYELLVSFAGLDAILADEDEVVEPTVETVVETVPKVVPEPPAADPVVPVVVPVVPEKKKGGRPPKAKE